MPFNPAPRRPERKDGVNFDVCQALKDTAFLECLEDFFRNYGVGCVITCARDQKGHSAKSAHGKGWALDVRTWHLFPKVIGTDRIKPWLTGFAEGLAKSLNMGHKEFAKERGYFYVVLEPTHVVASGANKGLKIQEHIHLEWAPAGYPPNIVGYEPLKFCYIKSLPKPEGAINGKTS